MPEIPNDIVLYHYTFSPYARRITWYLTLRKISYAQCLQPPTMPRPDLEALNISHRRIPLLSIGRDVYMDTRLILRKLETLFPDGALGATDPEHRALQRLLERWTVDGGVFLRASQLIPTNLPAMKDPAFQRDREQLTGKAGGWDGKRMEAARPEALVHMRDVFELLESTLLADGRQWVFKTEKPSLGDIEAIWPLHWLVDMPGALPESVISATQYPKVFAWIARFRDALKEARKEKPVTVKGPQVAQYLHGARFAETVGSVDAHDPLGLTAGEEVEVWPIDSGFSHRDRGTLLSLTPGEVVIGKKTKSDGKEIHLHMPRWGFRIARVKEGKL